MDRFVELLGLSTAMGLAIFLSLPVVLRKQSGSRSITFLNAAAIGILVFLAADVFSDAATKLYPNPADYVAAAGPTVYFTVALAGSFLVMYFLEHRSREGLTPIRLALLIAAAIGFQNLTEGLVFGGAWAGGAVGLSTVVFVGFFLQNVTEGFPITSPFLTRRDFRLVPVVLAFLVGGLPTIVGGATGYFYTSSTLEITFDALAIGSILYAILPMLRIAMRPATPPDSTYLRQRLLYLGVLAGFLIGFLVNAI